MRRFIDRMIFIVCGLFLLSASASAQSSSSPYQKYIKHVLTRLKKAPRNHRLHTILGRLYQKSGWYTKAQKQYRKALYLQPNYSHARVGLAHLALIQKRLPRALELLNRVLRRHPKHASALAEKSEYWRIRALRAQKARLKERYLARSIRSLQRAIVQKPNVHRYRYRLGILYLATKQYMLGHIQFAEAHARLSFHPCYKLGLVVAESLLRQKRPQRYQELKMGIVRCHHVLLTRIGQALFVAESTQKAEKLASSKQFGQAIQVMQKAIQLAPTIYEGYIFLALLQFRNHQCQASRRTLYQVLKRSPQHKGARKLLYHSKALRCGPLPSKRFLRKTYRNLKHLQAKPSKTR